MAKSNTKKEKTIIEIFYDEWDNEVKPSDPNYEKYLNGEEYYGSYFVDENENVVKKIDPNKKEDPEKKKAKRAEKNKEKISEEDATAKDILKGIAIVFGIIIALIASWFLIKEIIIPLVVVLLFFFYLIGRKAR